MLRQLIKYGTILIVLAAMSAGALLFVNMQVEWRARVREPKVNVGTAFDESERACCTVNPGEFTITVATGLVEAVRTEEVTSPIESAAVIISMLPEGTPVKKGELV